MSNLDFIENYKRINRIMGRGPGAMTARDPGKTLHETDISLRRPLRDVFGVTQEEEEERVQDQLNALRLLARLPKPLRKKDGLSPDEIRALIAEYKACLKEQEIDSKIRIRVGVGGYIRTIPLTDEEIDQRFLGMRRIDVVAAASAFVQERHGYSLKLTLLGMQTVGYLTEHRPRGAKRTKRPSRKGSAYETQARYEFFYIIHRILGHSLSKMGEIAGGYDHSTVKIAIDNYRKIQASGIWPSVTIKTRRSPHRPSKRA